MQPFGLTINLPKDINHYYSNLNQQYETLHLLSTYHNKISDEGCKYLANAKFHTIYLKFNKIGELFFFQRFIIIINTINSLF